MALKDQIENDYINALKERDDFRVSLLRMIKSSLKNQEIKTGQEVSNEDLLKILEKQAKQRRDSIIQYRAGNREDLAKTEEKELIIIEEYLPEKLSAEEIGTIIDEAITSLGVTSSAEMGKVIKEVMTITKNQADGKTVSELVKLKLV